MKNLIYILVVFFSLPSLQVIFPAPINLLWRLKIGFTELGVFFAIIVLSLSVILAYLDGNRVFVYSGFIAAFVYLLPLIKAIVLSFSIQSQLENAYGKIDLVPRSVIDFVKLIGLGKSPIIEAKTLHYNEVISETQSIDLYSDKSGKLKPCIVSVHGGAWSSGDNKMFIDFDKDMVSKGYVVADVNYRLAPDPIFPAQKQDIIAAIDYLVKHANELEIDTNKIFLLGRSAGGQIAAVTAFHLRKNRIKGLICFYTPHDMVWGYSVPGNPLILDSRKVLRDYLGGSPEEAKENFYASSPVHQVNNDIQPILMIHGESDEMVAYEHNLRLIDRIKSENVPYYLLSIPLATHGCDFFNNSHSAQLSTFAVEYFLKRFSD